LDFWFENKIKELPKEQQKIFPFLYVPKASTSERNKGLSNKGTGSNTYNRKCLICEKWERKQGLSDDYTCNCNEPKWEEPTGNIHATVKPIKILSYLIQLTTRENDIVLDPFIGSGTTAISSLLLKRRFIGFEKEKEYYDIATERIKHYQKQKML
jgi:site-specific DNA-methyltransferase (adenine-specific)